MSCNGCGWDNDRAGDRFWRSMVRCDLCSAVHCLQCLFPLDRAGKRLFACVRCSGIATAWHSAAAAGPAALPADYNHSNHSEDYMAKVTGTSQTSNALILKAPFWKVGRKVSGTITRHVSTKFGPLQELHLDKPMVIKADKKAGREERKITDVMLGNQRGLQLAAENAHVPWPYPIHTHVDITCTGLQNTGKQSPLALFSVDFDLPEEVRPADVDDYSMMEDVG